MKLLAGAPRVLTPLALAAAALALVLPSGALAGHSDELLALLVLVTALGIMSSDLARLRAHSFAVVVLSVAPLIVLAAVAWLVGRPFGTITRDGLLAVGLSSSEVASVGLVALAGADVTIALGAVTGSLIVAAVLGPIAIGWLAGGAGHADAAGLLGRLALVVLVPLAVGVGLRSAASLRPRLERVDDQREGVAAIAVAVLVYAALSGARGAHGLGAALVASLIFLALSAGLGELWRRRAGRAGSDSTAVAGALTIAMRDFAVAAALASQAFGHAAAAVPGVYGVVMLLGGSIASGVFARAARSAR